MNHLKVGEKYYLHNLNGNQRVKIRKSSFQRSGSKKIIYTDFFEYRDKLTIAKKDKSFFKK